LKAINFTIGYLAVCDLRYYTVVMAKINKVSRENIWQVRIHVDDPGCIWNVNPTASYYKIIKANNANAAIRGAATYCNRQMKTFPGAHFKYSTQDVKPYFYNIGREFVEQKEKPLVTLSKY
jgi:hypothetical protein